MSRTSAGVKTSEKGLCVFFSYANEDEAYRDQLERHFGFLKRAKKLKTWHDRKISAGQDWEKELSEHLNQAHIILLLISSDFSNSHYCLELETKRALERRRRGEALVIPVLIRPVSGLNETPLGALQALPKNLKPVSEWENQDEAYENIAEGLLNRINNWDRELAALKQERLDWFLNLSGNQEDYDEDRIGKIVEQLRNLAQSKDLEHLGSSPGSIRLQFRSTVSVFEVFQDLYAAGTLQSRLGHTVQGLYLKPSDPGAVLKLESRIVERKYQSAIQPLPEILGGALLEKGFPPLVGGITFPLDNPMKMGFSLLTDGSKEMPTPKEITEIQGRLGRYLNSFLVLTGDHVNVNLTPDKDYCGLPKLMRKTELGRDMLAQDVVLKHYTVYQLHPTSPQGEQFWNEVDTVTAGSQELETCFRVWIVPAGAIVQEKTEAGQGHVTIKKLGLEVLCDEDYSSLRRFRAAQGGKHQPALNQEQVKAMIDLFRKWIVPEIQREVSTGPRFGQLRQILSVLVIAKWIMKSRMGPHLEKAGFLGSNLPEKYGLNTVDEEVMHSMKRIYLQMFGEGIWRYTRNRINLENRVMEKRLYVAGKIDLDQNG